MIYVAPMKALAQFMIRFVRLSTTSPNYKDVAAFLRADSVILCFGNEYRLFH